MDDLKRTLYMRTQEMLRTGEATHLCIALAKATDEMSWDKSLVPHGFHRRHTWSYILDMPYLFSEFDDLKDGKRWDRDGFATINPHLLDEWWTNGWNEPRLRVFNLLLKD